MVLCGFQDVRDYRDYSYADKQVIPGGSPFNVKAESIRLKDFSIDQTKSLLGQYTQETGQLWSDEAIIEIWRLTQGQPGLVNALADEACRAVSDLDQAIELGAIEDARKQLIADRETRLEHLIDELKDQRVQNVMETVLLDERDKWGFSPHDRKYTRYDLEYVHELGLINFDNGINVANPIYEEIFPHYLT